jgi:hypothetical protein
MPQFLAEVPYNCSTRTLGDYVMSSNIISQQENDAWHVIWCTHLTWPPHDRRGDWTNLQQFYSELVATFLDVTVSNELHLTYLKRPVPIGHILLSNLAQAQLHHDIIELTKLEGDRIAGHTPIWAMAVQSNAVQLVLSCESKDLKQKVGRLKSRLATLLLFNSELNVGGRNTWSKGIWYARLTSEGAVHRAAEYVRSKNVF